MARHNTEELLDKFLEKLGNEQLRLLQYKVNERIVIKELNDAKRAAKKNHSVRICPICGNEFVDSEGKRFCSNKCLRKGYKLCREAVTFAPCMEYSRKKLVPDSLCSKCKLDRCRFD